MFSVTTDSLSFGNHGICRSTIERPWPCWETLWVRAVLSAPPLRIFREHELSIFNDSSWSAAPRADSPLCRFPDRHGAGERHPDTLATATNLASLLQETGRLKEAEPLIRGALEGFKLASWALRIATGRRISSSPESLSTDAPRISGSQKSQYNRVSTTLPLSIIRLHRHMPCAGVRRPPPVHPRLHGLSRVAPAGAGERARGGAAVPQYLERPPGGAGCAADPLFPQLLRLLQNVTLMKPLSTSEER